MQRVPQLKWHTRNSIGKQRRIGQETQMETRTAEPTINIGDAVVAALRFCMMHPRSGVGSCLVDLRFRVHAMRRCERVVRSLVYQFVIRGVCLGRSGGRHDYIGHHDSTSKTYMRAFSLKQAWIWKVLSIM